MRTHVRLLTRVASALFIAIFALMHWLRPEVSPVKGDISRYQTDLYGGLMNVGFVMFGLALVGASLEVRTLRRPGAPLVFGAGMASLIVAASPVGLDTADAVQRIHRTAAFALVAAAIGGAAAATGAFQSGRAGRFFGPVALSVARLAAVSGSLLLLGIAARAPLGGVLGLLHRMTLTALAVWTIAVARSAAARPSSGA